MRIIAFIQDEHSIKDIMKSQVIAEFRYATPQHFWHFRKVLETS
jgi:hypothetical protein